MELVLVLQFFSMALSLGAQNVGQGQAVWSGIRLEGTQEAWTDVFRNFSELSDEAASKCTSHSVDNLSGERSALVSEQLAINSTVTHPLVIDSADMT